MSEDIKEEKRKYGFYHQKGEKIKVVFLDGKAVTGTYLFGAKYEIYIETEDGREITIFKHAVKYVYVID
ncbi:hypothetical protein [Macrococcus psychrotolerans]|uniref:DUF2187 domain-containing protein n=1 Tax=Macrococcus psychrotolerans TaxID=3039389 RepID=A0AAT9PAZ2_9STAP|nr:MULTISPECIES: hypothetical protein [Macrococcus]QYA34213.1 hypothetical protein KYI10_12470 [Macrococcus sp. 19Msa1099]QYA39015.1 hypothetical protein KYI07_12450 [Macrococcus caseolyticus]QYA77726.1 hypothetical protein KYI12_12465 [Macrococcus caseolyticus]